MAVTAREVALIAKAAAATARASRATSRSAEHSDCFEKTAAAAAGVAREAASSRSVSGPSSGSVGCLVPRSYSGITVAKVVAAIGRGAAGAF